MAVDRSGFGFFGTTADLGLHVRAPGPDRLFSLAGEGLFSGICDRRTVRLREERRVKLEAEGVEALLVAWLNEIIYIFDTEKFLGRRCAAEVGGGAKALLAVISGEHFDPARHRLRTSFKAATWHRLLVREEGGGWKATVVFDV